MSKDSLLALKVQVDGSFADFSAGGHIVNRRPTRAILEENVPRGLKDVFTPLGFFALPTPSRAHRSPFQYMTVGHLLTNSQYKPSPGWCQEAICSMIHQFSAMGVK
jgi:hypothetical protein